jgi:hypothetical protein
MPPTLDKTGACAIATPLTSFHASADENVNYAQQQLMVSGQNR